MAQFSGCHFIIGNRVILGNGLWNDRLRRLGDGAAHTSLGQVFLQAGEVEQQQADARDEHNGRYVLAQGSDGERQHTAQGHNDWAQVIPTLDVERTSRQQ